MNEQHLPGRSAGRAMGVLNDLWREDLSLAEIAERHDVSLATLARWAAKDRNVRMMERLRDLVALRAGLLAARARAEASESLWKLASDRSNPETARKACVDLLKLEPDATPASSQAVSPERREATDESVLCGLLEKLGGTHD